jgi:hypothetical protein
MGKLVAVQGMTLSIVNGLPTPVEGTISITGSPSTINKVDGKGVYLDGLGISVTNVTSTGAGATTPDPGPITGSINASILYCKENGTLMLAEDDLSGVINATPKIPGTPPTDYPVTFQVQVTNANQNEVRAE